MSDEHLGLLLPEEIEKGKCPQCKSTIIKPIEICVSCGWIEKECLDCKVKWQESIQEEKKKE